MYEVGDIVSTRNGTGKVVFINGGSSGTEILVKVKGMTGGHNGNTWCNGGDYTGDKERDKWWYSPCDLKLVSKANDLIKSIKSHNPYTTIQWATGEETVVKCGFEDKFDINFGIALAILKYQLGNTTEAGIKAYDILSKVIIQTPQTVVMEEPKVEEFEDFNKFTDGWLRVKVNDENEYRNLMGLLQDRDFKWLEGQKPTEYTIDTYPSYIKCQRNRLTHSSQMPTCVVMEFKEFKVK